MLTTYKRNRNVRFDECYLLRENLSKVQGKNL